MAPCVLWIDEIEKGIGSDSHDGGTSRRVLGTLLTWLAEHKERVFIVATANDIESLPPELLRKGRLDEVFFVDLPDRDTRRIIARIHLEKRSLDAASFQLDDLADACEGFSGSEIEQAIVSSLYAAYAQKTVPGTAHVLQEMSRTRPLSVLMSEKIGNIRAWAAGRTVPAH
jgi:SpoVK/Ycf46/Vps4 family AAA+-type ATPase